MKVLENISHDLNVPKELLNEALNNSRKLVKILKIPKRDGSLRRVYQPSKKLKIIQYWLDEKVFKLLNVHDSAVAYRKEKSIKDNALLHREM